LILLVQQQNQSFQWCPQYRYNRNMGNVLEEFASMSEEEMARLRAKAHKTILKVYAHLPKSVSTSDLDEALNYYSRQAFWCGYANAIEHRQIKDKLHRDPRGRRTLRDAIATELTHDPNAPTLAICHKLDKLKLSARFTYRGKGLLVGPKYPSCTTWVEICDQPCIKMVISRLRQRARNEANARRWIQFGEKVFGGSVQVL
jgi:hypothetical protein